MTVAENVRINAHVPFPSNVVGTGYVRVAKINGIWTISFAYTDPMNIQSTNDAVAPTDVAASLHTYGGAAIEKSLWVGTVVTIGGWLSRGVPVTKTADFALASTENWIINAKAGSNCIATLPLATAFPGREVTVKTTVAFAVISGSANVVPRAGGAASTAITGAVAGNWATLVSDGANWVLMAGS